MSDGRVVVFGGTGFLGRQICQNFVAAGREVLVLGRTAPRAAAGCRFRAVDVARTPTRDLAGLLAAERPATIVNATGSKWGLTGRDLVDSCVGASRNIMAALAESAVTPRYIHLGSVLEYGYLAPPPVGPDSAYGQLKLAATETVLEAAAAGTVDAAVLRLANVVGPGAAAESLPGLVAGKLADADRRGEPALIEVTALNAHRDYVDVRDVADAVAAAARVPVLREPVAIGRGETVPVRKLVAMLVEVSGVRATVSELPSPDLSAESEVSTRVDLAPARELLGWAPRRTLRDAIEALWLDAKEERKRAQPVR
ncbi:MULTISPECIES: NAD-dependent epimerase/dehydratase family protein [Amycolatopsis]|uniref:NAD(P)-dependent oxidoreductase n=1 Tax=Amycolatopsis dendrobii TaxID=2760662 RepID=A0A7W3VVC5_9PSEU|nr:MULTISPECIES: NAD(P)-dependent oxidoreductase [Amycolatopsis]MBB1153835.1 NAD(P)-dependent oxidoreductase [Amycolatopsis dendrobii]UKD51715.1 NAD(P)-dependent oxidoreductase [Amycolatopsis sp. FU40]